MPREERVTVQGRVKKQKPDGMSHRGSGRGAGGRGRVLQALHFASTATSCQCPNFPYLSSNTIFYAVCKWGQLQSRPALTPPIRVYPDDCICWSHIQAWSHTRCILCMKISKRTEVMGFHSPTHRSAGSCTIMSQRVDGCLQYVEVVNVAR